MVLGYSHERKPFSPGGPDFSDYAARQLIRIARPRSKALISDYFGPFLRVMVELASTMTGKQRLEVPEHGGSWFQYPSHGIFLTFQCPHFR